MVSGNVRYKALVPNLLVTRKTVMVGVGSFAHPQGWVWGVGQQEVEFRKALLEPGSKVGDPWYEG